MTANNTLTIREPLKPELPLCRMLLPKAAATAFGRHFRLAFAEDRIAAALSWRDDAAALGAVRLHVVPPLRRKRIGSMLLNYAADEARRLGRTIILAEADLNNESEAEPFLVANNFRKVGAITCAEIDIQDLRASMAALPSAVPANLKFVGLSDAPGQEVARLYAEHIAQMSALAGLRDTLGLDRAVDSVVLLLDGKVAGFALARIDAGVLHIPAWVVIPEYRRGGMGYLLLAQLAERVRGRIERMRFEFSGTAMVTSRMLTVPGCRVTEIAARFEKVLQ